MSLSDKQNKISILGKVRKIKGGGLIIVELDNGAIIDCHVSGKIKKYNVHIILGDTVEVEISPYDLTKGRIVKRLLDPKPEEA